MLKSAAIVLFSLISIAFLWLLIPTRPSIDAIAEIARIKVSAGTKILAFEHLSDGREPEFIVALSLPEGGNNFCKINNLTEQSFSSKPLGLGPGQTGYALSLGKPGLCYAVKELGNGGIYVVARPREAVIYVDDR